ncbi:hypothetical protein Aple_056070 [Acrocarpospora pleiomorpha]|uniref:S-adenosyl methyltransferase n=1 Tax=Acrocarpospora pleiomorpha TaxID=90975 RepID=A0A5M3XRV4_9ACTN|nr:SAM-dependent methyltransferase [Acrocarpospora pleiomorpha]GES22709.1 hypothetical protein Aple_056070 [Acrocarpospora pleiomorpha]
MSESYEPPPGLNPAVPSVARMYDYWLGGKDNFSADREAAEEVIRLVPGVRELARENRAFLRRAVEHLTKIGIRQFIDIGAGLPTRENTHDVAQRLAPDARVVYVDNDPVVLAHARALLANNSRTIAVEGDLREPKSIFDHPELLAHLDLELPTAVLMLSVLHFITADRDALAVVAQVRDSLPTGSHIVISHIYAGDMPPDERAAGRAIYARTSSGPAADRSLTCLTNFFTGTTLLAPGLVPVHDWHPDHPVPPRMDTGKPYVLGGVGTITR